MADGGTRTSPDYTLKHDDFNQLEQVKTRPCLAATVVALWEKKGQPRWDNNRPLSFFTMVQKSQLSGSWADVAASSGSRVH